MNVEFTGVLTERQFSYDPLQHLPSPGCSIGPGTPTMSGHHKGVDLDSGEPVYVRAVDDRSPLHADTICLARRAITVANAAAVTRCATIVQLLDYEDRTVDVYSFGENYGVVSSAWEWGERVLLDELCHGHDRRAALAAAVEANIGAALASLHTAGLVHSDLAPNNIVRVAGEWKLTVSGT